MFDAPRLNIKSNEKIIEVFASFRESVVRNRRDYYARNIGSLRFSMAGVSAERAFMPLVSKYVIETSVIVGALLIGSVQFVLHDTAHAVATLSIFQASGSRIAPAVLRVQQSSVQIRGSLGQALPTLELSGELGNSPLIENVEDSVFTDHKEFEPLINRGASKTDVLAITKRNRLFMTGSTSLYAVYVETKGAHVS